MERGAQLEEFCRTEHILGLAEPYNTLLFYGSQQLRLKTTTVLYLGVKGANSFRQLDGGDVCRSIMCQVCSTGDLCESA